MTRAVALVAAAWIAGCSSQAAPRAGALTDRELHWVRSYVHWRTAFSTHTQGGGSAHADEIGRCGGSLARSVGRAPTPRLRRVDVLVRRACREWRRYALLARRFFERNDFSAGPALEAAATHATTDEERAFHSLERLLQENRRVPRIDGPSAASHAQPRYTRIVERVTSRPARVTCWDGDDWDRVLREAAAFEDVASVDADAYAKFYDSRVDISPEVCRDLDDLVYRGERPRHGDALDDAAYAVLVLAHEAEHVAGVDDEALATCNGMQHIVGVARLLGLGRAYARVLADAYWRDVYEDEPPDYRSDDCAPGKSLDLSPADGAWP